MRRMLVAAVILGLIIWGWSIEEKVIGEICGKMIENVEKMQNATGDELDSLIEKTRKEWSENEKILEMLTPHEDTDDINVNWESFNAKVKAGNYSAAKVTLAEMGQHFKEMKSKIKVNFQNIF